MVEDRGGMEIRYTSEEDALSSEIGPVFPVSRWKFYLTISPSFYLWRILKCFLFLHFSLCCYTAGEFFAPELG
jgi:hypothetical protein